MRISDWSSDVCSSDLCVVVELRDQVDHAQSRLGDVAEQRQPPDDRALRGDGRVLLAESLDQVNRAAVAVVAHLQGSFQRASIGPYRHRGLPLYGHWSPSAGTSRGDRQISAGGSAGGAADGKSTRL